MLQLWLFSNTVLWPLSAKVGGSSLSLSVVLLTLIGALWIGVRGTITLGSARVLLVFMAYVVFSSVLTVTGPCNSQLQKAIFTVPVLIFLVLVGLEVGRRASERDWASVQRTAIWSLVVAFSAFIVEMLHPAWFPEQARYRAEGKLSGLFQEPSHVAFGLFPCIVVLLVAGNKRTRITGVCALVALVAVSRSSTLIALIAAWVLYRLVVQRKIRQTALFAVGVVALMTVGAVIDFDRFITPTMGRIVGIATPSETENVSSLVYVQGWQDAWFNLERTHGMGLGLNMMGCGDLPDVSARLALDLAGLQLNAEDGSFLFAKVVSETGVIGIALYVGIIWWWIELEKKLRGLENAARFAVEAQTALIFSFLASSFIRSSSYFYGGLLIAVVAVGGASRWLHSSQIAQPHAFISPARKIVGTSASLDDDSGLFSAPRENE
jgi:hypothetical protein